MDWFLIVIMGWLGGTVGAVIAEEIKERKKYENRNNQQIRANKSKSGRRVIIEVRHER